MQEENPRHIPVLHTLLSWYEMKLVSHSVRRIQYNVTHSIEVEVGDLSRKVSGPLHSPLNHSTVTLRPKQLQRYLANTYNRQYCTQWATCVVNFLLTQPFGHQPCYLRTPANKHVGNFVCMLVNPKNAWHTSRVCNSFSMFVVLMYIAAHSLPIGYYNIQKKMLNTMYVTVYNEIGQ